MENATIDDAIILDNGELDLGETALVGNDKPTVRLTPASEAKRFLKRAIAALREIDAVEASYEADLVALSLKRDRVLEKAATKRGLTKAAIISRKMDEAEANIEKCKRCREMYLRTIAKPWDVYAGKKGVGKFIVYYLYYNGDLKTAMRKSGTRSPLAHRAMTVWTEFVDASLQMTKKRMHKRIIEERGKPYPESLQALSKEELWWLEIDAIEERRKEYGKN